MEKLISLSYAPKNIDYGYVDLPRNGYEIKGVPRISSEKIAKVGYVGRFSPEKGIESLIQSLQALRIQYGIDSELFLVGKGNPIYVSELKVLASKLGIVANFTDYSDTPYAFLRPTVDLIVIPSEWEETLGRVAFEALANGFQVIVSDIGGLPEAASLSGEDFFAFIPGDIDDLARKIRCFVLGEKPNRTGSAVNRPILHQIISRLDRN
jgi:glycosyltransferase involved in cell wall biosynthesis